MPCHAQCSLWVTTTWVHLMCNPQVQGSETLACFLAVQMQNVKSHANHGITGTNGQAKKVHQDHNASHRRWTHKHNKIATVQHLNVSRPQDSASHLIERLQPLFQSKHGLAGLGAPHELKCQTVCVLIFGSQKSTQGLSLVTKSGTCSSASSHLHFSKSPSTHLLLQLWMLAQ